MAEPRQWRKRPPPDEAWKPPPGRSYREARAEQDAAAGGRSARQVELPDGRVAHASIELKRPQGRRVYAYLRWHQDGRTVTRYLGEVTAEDRHTALRRGWAEAQHQGYTTSPTI